MRIRKIDFDPPPPPSSSPQHPAYFDNYDIREYNHSSSSTVNDDSDRAFIHVNDNNDSNYYESSNRKVDEEEMGGDDDEIIAQKEQQQQDGDQGDCDAVSITWSNAPGIEVDSPKSSCTEYDVEVDDIIICNVNNNNNNNKYGSSDCEDQHERVTTCHNNNNDTDTTIYDDDDYEEEDEHSSVFLSWPELPATTSSFTLPQHEQIKQRCSESVGSERPPWFHWGRRASDTDVILTTTTTTTTTTSPSCGNGNTTNNDEQNNGNNTNNNDAIMDKQKSTNDECLVPTNQQWWQFGRRRNTFDSYSGGGRKSSAVASNVQNSGRWHIMDSFMNGGEDSVDKRSRSSSAKSSSAGSNDVNSDSTTLVIDNRNKMPIRRLSSAESNTSSFNSSVDGETRPKPARMRRKSTENNTSFTSLDDGDTKFTKKPYRRKGMENNKSSITSVDDEVNDWLFPRRGRRASITSPQGSLRNIVPQSQDEDGVEVIVDKLKKSSVDISPLDRMLLKDMASSTNSNRWRNRSSISGADGGQNENEMDLGRSTFSMQASENDFGHAIQEEAHNIAPSRELNDSLWSSQHGVPEIYWDSDKISQMKKEGVSLARAKVLDEVSSIASSDHSGKLIKRRHPSKKRLSFTSSLFGRNSAINEEDVDDDCSFKPEKIVPFKPDKIAPKGTSGKLSSMKSSIRPKSMSMSTPPSLLSKARRRASIDYDDYDDDEMYSIKNPLAKEDLKHEAIVKEANEIMTSVNNSVIAMGMTAPFRPMEEICPSFQKLHKNLGYQMDALNAAIVRTTKAQISKRQGLKKSKSKKLKASNFKSSQYSMSSGSSLTDSSNQSTTMSILNDSEAMSKFILAQMALLQSQQQTGDGSSITTNVTPRSFYTSWLPNYMWYQTIAADASSVMRPTSLCSGTGITRDEQYLNPDMLKVFEMFSTYFVGSKHLFQEEDEDEDGAGANMRRSYWMDTIEEIDSADESSEKSTSSDSELSDQSDMVYELGEVGSADIDQFVDTEKQIEILQTVINDLRKSRLSNRPFVSIEASARGPDSNLSASTSTDERNTSSRDSNFTSSTITNEMNTSGRESNFTSSTSTNEMNGSGRDSNFTSSTLTQDI